MNPTRRLLFATTLSCALLGLAQAQSGPKVESAWARPTVAGQSGGGAFLKIKGGAASDRLLSASAGVAKMVELHTMEMEGNVMRMRALEGIEVPAGKAVELKPGGMHLMLMGLTQPLKSGSSFPLTLKFAKAGEVKVEVKVMSQPPGGAGTMPMPMPMHKP